MKLNWDEILSTCCIDFCIQVHMVTFNRLGLHSLFSFSSKPNNGNYRNVGKPLHFISESVEWPQAHTKNGNNISLSLPLPSLSIYPPQGMVLESCTPVFYPDYPQNTSIKSPVDSRISVRRKVCLFLCNLNPGQM